MKHLRKFNENKEEVLDIEYIKHCFVEILDDDDAEAEIDISDMKSCLFIVNQLLIII